MIAQVEGPSARWAATLVGTAAGLCPGQAKKCYALCPYCLHAVAFIDQNIHNIKQGCPSHRDHILLSSVLAKRYLKNIPQHTSINRRE
jgi:hypothetical protein